MTSLVHSDAQTLGRRRWLAADRARQRAEAAGAARLWPQDSARGLALFFGLFALANLVGELRVPGFDENIWWLDLRPLPVAATALVLALAGLLLVAFALRPQAPRWRRTTTSLAVAALGAVALWNGVAFYRAWELGQIRPFMPLPLSFLFAAALFFIAWRAALPAPTRSSRLTPLRIASVLVLCGLLFPLAQQLFFGKTEYVRPAAQVAVVFGAQVHGSGKASVCLVDRVRTAAGLYHAGLAQRLLLSGAQGVGEPVNETVVMRQLALGFGVPASAIALDPAGFNTEATVRDTVARLRAAGVANVAVVSDFFHLPRVKLAYQRAGYDVVTVPSRAHRIPQTTGLVLREIPAFWVYYLRAVVR